MEREGEGGGQWGRERGGFFRDVRRWSAAAKRRGRSLSHLQRLARGVLGSDCLPTCLPISAHLVKINNYDETYEAAERPGDDPLD